MLKEPAGNCRQNCVEGAAGNCRQTVSKEPRETVGRTLSKTESKAPKTYSQVWKGDKLSCGKLPRSNVQGAMLDSSEGPRETAGRTVQGNMARSSRGCGKLQQKIEIQLQTTRLDHHNLQVTGHGYVEKVFTNLRRKLNRTENDEMF